VARVRGLDGRVGEAEDARGGAPGQPPQARRVRPPRGSFAIESYRQIIPSMELITAQRYLPGLGTLCLGFWVLVDVFVGRVSPVDHDPFVLDQYTTIEVAIACGGLSLFVAGCVQLVLVWRYLQMLAAQTSPKSFDRAGMYRSIYEMLLGVAAIDDQVDVDKRAVIERIMRNEAAGIITSQDLKNWSTTVEPPRNAIEIAKNLVPLLTPLERAAAFEWCCAVTETDEANREKADMLRQLQILLAPPDVTPGLRG
jgi:hypothetical protein